MSPIQMLYMSFRVCLSIAQKFKIDRTVIETVLKIFKLFTDQNVAQVTHFL